MEHNATKMIMLTAEEKRFHRLLPSLSFSGNWVVASCRETVPSAVEMGSWMMVVVESSSSGSTSWKSMGLV